MGRKSRNNNDIANKANNNNDIANKASNNNNIADKTNNNNDIANQAENVEQEVTQASKRIKTEAHHAAGEGSTLVDTTVDVAKDKFAGAADTIKHASHDLSKKVNEAKDVATNLTNAAMTKANEVVHTAQEKASTLTTTIKDGVSTAASTVAATATNITSNLPDIRPMIPTVEQLREGAKNLVSATKEKIHDAATVLSTSTETIKTKANEAFEAAGTTIKENMPTKETVSHTAEGVLTGVDSVTKKINSLADDAKTGCDDAKSNAH